MRWSIISFQGRSPLDFLLFIYLGPWHDSCWLSFIELRCDLSPFYQSQSNHLEIIGLDYNGATVRPETLVWPETYIRTGPLVPIK